MAKRMKSLRLDEELCAWSEGYAVERGVSWASVLEAALREFQASAMTGVPDLGPESKPAAVTPLVRSGGGTVHSLPATPKPEQGSGESWRSLAWARQQKLNAAKYGGAA